MKRALLAPVAILGLLGIACAGCRTERGGSSIEMLEPTVPTPPKSDAKGDVTATNVVINPIPPSIVGDLMKPVYPPAALAAHAGACIIYATITINTDGNVSEVRPTWQRVNMPNKFSGQFMDAVRAAVGGWKFEPARDVYWEKDASGELKYLRTETRAAMTDIKFTFEPSGSVK